MAGRRAYGDTHGLHLDNYREIWPYRDWVINAFNRNMPFDQFVVEQLAGDLLPGATLDQTVATGFTRCHVTTSEGGSIEEEVYVRNVVDQVDTTGTVFFGLSVGCARCHDHKYDPVKQKDYYQLFAYFNSIDGGALDGNAMLPPPVIRVGSQAKRDELAAAKKKVDAVRTKIAAEVATIKYDEPAPVKDPRLRSRSNTSGSTTTCRRESKPCRTAASTSRGRSWPGPHIRCIAGANRCSSRPRA